MICCDKCKVEIGPFGVDNQWDSNRTVIVECEFNVRAYNDPDSMKVERICDHVCLCEGCQNELKEILQSTLRRFLSV
jgi:hypothetical protein